MARKKVTCEGCGRDTRRKSMLCENCDPDYHTNNYEEDLIPYGFSACEINEYNIINLDNP